MKNKLGPELLQAMTRLATFSFGLMVGLAWNEVFLSIIPTSNLLLKALYAFFALTIAVLSTYLLGKLVQRVSDKESR